MARPLTGTTLALTDTGTTALVVGGAVGATAGTGTILSGPIKIASATPSDTSMKLYNIAGTLTWNGTTLAAGSSVSGTTGKLPKFTSSNSVGDSIVAESGTIITVTGTLNATTAIQLNGTSINTGATLTNVAYLDQSNTFSNASGQKFAAGIGIDGGVPSTHGIMMPTGVPGVTTTTLYNNSGVLTWPSTGVSVAGTLAVTGVATFTAQPILSSLTASQAVFSDASKGLVSNAITGSGNVVMSASPTLTGTIGAANMTLSGTLGVTGLITSTGGITGGASSHTTGTFSSTLGVTGVTTLSTLDITSAGGVGNASGPVARFMATGSNAANRNWALIDPFDNFGELAFRISTAKDGDPSLTASGSTIMSLSASSVNLKAGTKLYLDAVNGLGGDTYIYESSSNVAEWVVGGTQMLRLRQSAAIIDVFNADLGVQPTKKLYLDGGGDTYISEGSANNIEVHAGSTQYYFANTLVELPTVYTSTSGASANVVVLNGGQLLRSTSSLRYKDDVQPFSGGLTELLKLQPVSFISKNETEGPRYIGFTAEAFDAAGFYNVVNYDDQGRPDAIQYDRLTTYLVNAVKELSAEVDALKTAQGKAVTHPASAVDAASRTKAIAKEQAAKAVRDAERLAECKANNVQLTQEP